MKRYAPEIITALYLITKSIATIAFGFDGFMFVFASTFVAGFIYMMVKHNF